MTSSPAPNPAPRNVPALPAFTPVLPPVDAQQRRALRAAQGLDGGPATPQREPDAWARASAWGRAAARLTVAPNGLVPCALTTASTAVAVQPWVATAVSWSQSTRFFHFAAPLLGPAAGAAILVTGLVLATASLAVAQLARQRFGASTSGPAALLATHAMQAALGLALAPCVMTSLTLFGAAGGVVLAGVVGVTLVLGCKRAAGQAPSLMGASALIGACLLVGPVGWAVACGMAPHVAIAQSVALYGMWLFATAATGVVAAKLVHAAPTPDFEEGLIAPENLTSSRFERPGSAVAGAASPTIFDVDESLWELVGRLKPELPKDPTAPFLGFRGQPVRHFHGPAGGGKTRSTLGLARELGAYYRSSDANELESDRLGDLPVAAIKACLLLLSADAYGRKMRRPVVLLLDEVDAMLPTPDGVQDQERINRALGFVLFVHLLRLLQRNGSYVVLITATNRYEAYEPMLRLLGQNGSAYLGAPSRESKRKVLTAGLRQMSLSLRRRVPWAPRFDEQKEEVDALLKRCEESASGSLSLRSMANLARVGFEAGCGESARQGARGVTQGEAVRKLVRYAFASMHAELAAGEEGHEPKNTHGPDGANAAPATAAAPQRSRRADARAQVNLDRLLQQTGLRDTSTMQVFQSLVENVGREYPKPENAIAFARLELRLANLFALTVLQLGRSATAEVKEPLHQQVYVPEARPLDWLPSPTGVVAAGFRAARSRLRAGLVLRRGRASR